MSARAPIVSRSFKVGSRTVTLSVPRPEPGKDVHAVCEWDPEIPPRLTGDELHQYRTGRDAAFAEIAEALGLKGAVFDV